jgi:hypothetical protein
MQAWGIFLAAVCLGVLAVVLGLTNSAAWVVLPALVGLLMSGWGLVLVGRRCRDIGTLTAESYRRWTVRGLSLMMLSLVPTYVAVGGAAFAMSNH